MSDSINNLPNSALKKGRLGRGLGSLLGGAAQADMTSQVNTQPAPTPVSAAPSIQKPVSTPTQVTTQTSVPTQAIQVAKIADEAQIWKISIDRLKANTQQPRQTFEPGPLKELAASIKEKGILQPIVARRIDERNFEIIAGERRWRAAQLAGLHEVPVVLKKVSEQDSLEYAIIENIQRENLNPLEEAEAYDHLLKDYSLTQQQVADKVGKERATVANSLRLLLLAPEIKDMLKTNQISAGHAKVLLSVEGTLEQVKLARQVIHEKLSVRATEKLAAKTKNPGKAPGSGEQIKVDVSKRLVDGLSVEMQRLLGTKVAIDYADSKGKISIHFYSDEELTGLVEKIRKACQK